MYFYYMIVKGELGELQFYFR